MRDIKFRAWDCDNKKMSYSFLDFSNIEELGYALDGFEDYFGRSYFKDNPSFLMQYTGLKDRNGVDVYEGDIVEYNDGVKVNVIFKDGCFCGYDGYAASSDEAYTLLVPEETPFKSFDFEIKVIGNIHENPEILEVK